MLDGISAVLGALVVLTSFLFIRRANFPAMLSATGCGLAIIGLAFLDGLEPEPWTRWGSGVLGAWVAVSPWFLQRAFVPPDAVLASPMAEPAVSMPIVLGLAIVVTAGLDITRTVVESKPSISRDRSEHITSNTASVTPFRGVTEQAAPIQDRSAPVGGGKSMGHLVRLKKQAR
ncbi:hypothetical protein ASG52_07280 [Methylobacterium sp. Leaf456]|uniref:SPW repeat domain-containing protein n=1 Tax=Methylobacterium sp. Leaf456 TaxID=1736382 RepID=UPI0006FDEEE3|nr:hypothetical protein [Methylobacterium sp. Leaf456]KQT50600.1 hypothetical protein ASG52_07280 [Methylobacterium sp. Leaf456]